MAFIEPAVNLDDNDAVSEALADLAKRKPHLVAPEPKKKLPRRPAPGGGNGEPAADDGVGSLEGKERAAAALRQIRNTH
jgi:hypothetical protein